MDGRAARGSADARTRLRRLLVRADGDESVGLGHLRRCLTIALALRRHGVEAELLTTSAAGRRLAEAEGFAARVLDAEPGSDDDVAAVRGSPALVDSYAWGAEQLAAAGVLAAMDDRCRFPFPCRLVVNGALEAASLPYAGEDTEFLLGPRYAPLRREFWDGLPPAHRVAGRVLVVFGGADLAGLMPATMAALDALPGPLRLVAAVGPLARNADEVRGAAAASRHRTELLHAPEALAATMAGCELAISAGGATLVELAATGTPAVAIEIADNQRPGIAALAGAGACVEARSPKDATRAAGELLADPCRRAAMSAVGPRLLDGRGALRIAERLARLL